MHDPLTVAFEIRRPWPRRDTHRTKQAARTGERWKAGSAFWVLAGQAVYWPCLVTVWHHDPSGYDHTTCRGQRWRWHIHHWRIQIVPLQALRRRLFTRCSWCKGRHTRKDQVNVSHQWDRAPGRWWQGEVGLYHRDCSLIQIAHRTCVCVEPMLLNDYPRCLRCGSPRAFGMTAQALEQRRARARIPHGMRALPAEDS
jgi:hypothetical protein